MKFNRIIALNAAIAICAVVFLVSTIRCFPKIQEQAKQQKCRIDKGTSGKKVQVVNTENGWRLLVDCKPFFVKGVCYNYVPIGHGGDYDLFLSSHKPHLIDGALMKKMGINAIRIYKPGSDVDATKAVINDFYKKFGIRTALGNFLGFWDWPAPNYSDPQVRAKYKRQVLDMVRNYKDAEGLLFWIIGNENNYAFDRGVRDWSNDHIEGLPTALERREAKARIYYKYVNEIAEAIKEIDTEHPVVMGNGELTSIHIAKDLTPAVDILGGIVYQGKTFGTYFKRLERNYGKPNCFIEFGADRYDADNNEENQDWQAFFLKMQWLEILENETRETGEGNSLGGFVFEWVDEWWKHNPGHEDNWGVHDIMSSWANTAYYYDAKARYNMNEEWWGIVSMDPDKRYKGIEKRNLTKAYYALRNLWANQGIFTPCMIASFASLILGLGLGILRSKIRKP